MGLRTTNYTIERTGSTLPQAYAIIDRITNEKNSVFVTFGIYASREKSEKYAPEETKHLHFVWDRKSNLAVTAYNEAKGQKEVMRYNPKTEKEEPVLVNGILYGWVDDIV